MRFLLFDPEAQRVVTCLKIVGKKKDGSCFHELAINSKILDGVSLIALCQTIVHEQCKILQITQGTACRSGYHDTKWAKTMESIGLIPSHTGKPRGKKTGQKMSSYIDRKGKFFDACLELIKRGFNLEWIDTNHYKSNNFEVATDLPNETATEALISALERKLVQPEELSDKSDNAPAKRKIKYHCASCNSSVWGGSQDLQFSVCIVRNHLKKQRNSEKLLYFVTASLLTEETWLGAIFSVMHLVGQSN